jgi:hypothetical protein
MLLLKMLYTFASQFFKRVAQNKQAKNKERLGLFKNVFVLAFPMFPELLFCHPEPTFLSPQAYFFVTPRRQPRGLPLRAPSPNEVRDARLALGTTKQVNLC